MRNHLSGRPPSVIPRTSRARSSSSSVMDLRWFKAMTPDQLLDYLSTNPFHAQWEKFDSFGFTVCGEPLK